MNHVFGIHHLAVELDGRRVLRDVTLGLGAGEVVLLLGRSGTGKSVLIKAALGFLPVAAGHVTLKGRVETPQRLVQSVSLVHQAPALMEEQSSVENIVLPLQWRFHLSHAPAAERALQSLERVGAASVAHTPAAQLSAGQRKLVAVARALAMQPLALLLDEPTTGLDAASAARVGRTVGNLAREGMAILVVTHDIEPFRHAATRVAMLHDGVLLLDQPAQEAFDTPSPAMRQFLTASSEGPLGAGAQP
jgi:ABC-type polar amino acid transport system ATPase subunit